MLPKPDAFATPPPAISWSIDFLFAFKQMEQLRGISSLLGRNRGHVRQFCLAPLFMGVGKCRPALASVRCQVLKFQPLLNRSAIYSFATSGWLLTWLLAAMRLAAPAVEPGGPLAVTFTVLSDTLAPCESPFEFRRHLLRKAKEASNLRARTGSRRPSLEATAIRSPGTEISLRTASTGSPCSTKASLIRDSSQTATRGTLRFVISAQVLGESRVKNPGTQRDFSGLCGSKGNVINAT